MLTLPPDFCLETYRKLYPHLAHYSDTYIFRYFGKKPHLPYKPSKELKAKDFVSLGNSYCNGRCGDPKSQDYKIQYPYPLRDIAISSNKMFSSFQIMPILFHKYILHLEDPKKKIQFEILQEPDEKRISHLSCHLHIFDLKDWELMFEKTFSLLALKNIYVIITFSFGTVPPLLLEHPNVTLLKIPNKGMDIGGKICAMDYLFHKKLEFEYILFLHSKKNNLLRNQWFDSFVRDEPQLDHVLRILKNFPSLLGIFPQDTLINNHYLENEFYYQDMMHLLHCDPKSSRLFSAGNCMILHKKVLDYIFAKRTRLLYNCLNSSQSFDYNWVKLICERHLQKKNVKGLNELYSIYLKERIPGNQLDPKNTLFLPDGMVEHVFERIWIQVIRKLNGSYITLGPIGCDWDPF